MSDVPGSYFVNGVELVDYRNASMGLSLYGPGEVVQKKNKKNRRSGGGSPKRSFLIQRDGMDCHYCGCEMVMPKGAFEGGPNAVSVEHIVPKSAKGGNEPHNLVLACKKCNSGFGSFMLKCDCDFCIEARRIHGEKHLV